jgi:two-component system nitrate/nitrite response regulator NarL
VSYDLTSDRRHSYGVVLVGTSELFLEGVRRLLQGTEFHTLASAPSVDQLPELHAHSHEGLLLILDGGRDIEDALRQISAFTSLHATARVAVIQGSLRVPSVIPLLQAGAHACFPESTTAAIFLKSLELVMLGQTLVPSFLLTCIQPVEPEITLGVPSGVQLSPQEEKVLAALVQGQPNKIIARGLGTSEVTVKVTVRSILRKLGMTNRTQAAAWGMRRGLFKGPPQYVPPRGSAAALAQTIDLSSSPVIESPSEKIHEPASAVTVTVANRAVTHSEQIKSATSGTANSPAGGIHGDSGDVDRRAKGNSGPILRVEIQSGGVMRRRKSKSGPATTLANETPSSPMVSRAANARPRFEYTDRFNGDPPPGRSALDRERATSPRNV